ncbi:hypothetical protein H9M94_02750 [Mycoplasma sp. Pen4]|uniref:hypothetical protein n=1 Tax=Mycoplasma sp. Pen4 TaxID=640330 RepID=UPI001654C113|nr:hypothetical protein [Mycoplasma sp. Pen4]QNM93505.1 hypothetical protein H9M94_02750 [Mycoplasma sp. Pen4]
MILNIQINNYEKGIITFYDDEIELKNYIPDKSVKQIKINFEFLDKYYSFDCQIDQNIETNKVILVNNQLKIFMEKQNIFYLPITINTKMSNILNFIFNSK